MKPKKSKTKSRYIVSMFIIAVMTIPFIIYITGINNKFLLTENENNILVNYKYNIDRNYTDFSKRFTDRQIIRVENKSDELKVVSLKWIGIKNTLKYQDKFLYKISCEGIKCNSISFSQMPAFDFSLFSDVYIEPGYDIIYTIMFSYKGPKDTKGYFKGKLVIKEEITDKKKYEEYMKYRESKAKWIKKNIEKNSNMDDQ